jgi:hypothetical protein
VGEKPRTQRRARGVAEREERRGCRDENHGRVRETAPATRGADAEANRR